MDTLTGLKVLGRDPPHLTFDHGFPIIQLSQLEEIKKTQLSWALGAPLSVLKKNKIIAAAHVKKFAAANLVWNEVQLVF